MQAFTETVKESLRIARVDKEVVVLFNKDITSYDVEDSALSLMFCEAIGIVMPLISGLEQELFNLAKKHRETLMVGLTHGQLSEVTTMALKLLNFREMVKRCDHESWERQVHLLEVLIERGVIEMVLTSDLEACFELYWGLEHLLEIYDRYGL